MLKAYLESREKEVVDIMMALFNKEQVLEAYVEERQEARDEGKLQEKEETALNLYNMGMKEEHIAKAVNAGIDLVRQGFGLVTA